MAEILLIEDDPLLVEGLLNAFTFHGHHLRVAGDGVSGVESAREHPPELVLLDVMLPGPDGFEVCRRLRAGRPDLPVIFLTARGPESDRLLGFAAGGDDYVTKPFSVAELLARVSALLRRSKKTLPGGTVRVEGVVVDLDGYTVRRGEKETPLTPKERDILALLACSPDRAFSRDEIIDRVWGDEYSPTPKTVDNFILKLRALIEEDPREPRHLLAVHGRGYKFRP